MLTIREEQMEVFAEEDRKRFTKALAEQLRADYPEEAGEADENELLAFVSAQVEKARAYGIEREAEVAIYVDRAAYYGADWDERLEWAREIFNDDDLDGPARIEAIRRYEATSLEAVE